MKTLRQIGVIVFDAIGYVFAAIVLAGMVVYAYIGGAITTMFCIAAEACEDGAGASLSNDIKDMFKTVFSKLTKKELDLNNPF